MSEIAISNRSRSIWRSRLGSAFRTGFACGIVGCISLFGPVSLQHMIGFPALSYVTVMLIVSEATLGDALHGCWNALYATLQGAVPGVLILWLLGHTRFWLSTIVCAVTVSTFLIVLPSSTHMVTKRIALAQIVILYSVTSVEGVQTDPLLHPVHVGVSTVVAALASVVALLLPFPRLACHEVREKCNTLDENASERLDLYIKGFCAENKTEAQAYLSQAKSLGKMGRSLLQTIKLKQESMQWEIPRCISSVFTYKVEPIDRLQTLETVLQGMEIALTSSSLFPLRVADQELGKTLLSLTENVTLKKSDCSLYSESSTVSEANNKFWDKFLQTLQPMFPTQDDLPSFFFLFCVKLIQSGLISDQQTSKAPNIKKEVSSHKQERSVADKFLGDWHVKVSTERLMLALKCSFSLGLAVFVGMLFSKDNGFWSGLAVAVGMAFGREATFKIANLKAQGTVLGSIYGIFCFFIFQRFLELRFFSLLPWIIFTSFLRSSRMYGPTGAMSAIIGALIILGRKDYGSPSEFAMVRILEVFIALTCSVVVDLLLRSKRPSTLAKIQLSQSLGALHDCVQSMPLRISSVNKEFKNFVESKEKGGKLTIELSALCKIIGEADVEPNFWFIPFCTTSYGKLHNSLSKMLELMFFATRAVELFVQESHTIEDAWKEHQEILDGDLEYFRMVVGSSIKHLKEVTSIRSLSTLESDMKRRDTAYDLELGKSRNIDEDEIQKVIGSFVQHSNDAVKKILALEVENNLKSQMVLSLSTLGFCMHGLMKETRKLEKSVKDLFQWENPSTHVNLCELHCKVTALYM
ncbi:hypothetical protein ACHQM5_021424 [Ranunculus cassubicifolius]